MLSILTKLIQNYKLMCPLSFSKLMFLLSFETCLLLHFTLTVKQLILMDADMEILQISNIQYVQYFISVLSIDLSVHVRHSYTTLTQLLLRTVVIYAIMTVTQAHRLLTLLSSPWGQSVLHSRGSSTCFAVA